jgi:hypothetical protein
MEEDTKNFLVLIANTISMVLLWMMLHVWLGIYFGWGFFEEMPDWKNGIYYVFFIVSFILLIKHLKKKWAR